MKSKILNWLAIAALIEIGLLHFATSQHAFEHAPYLGYMFIFNFLGALVAAYGIYRQRRWGWWLGFAVAAGSFVGYTWSRTLGLPGVEVETWLVPSGIMSLAMEALFLLVMFMRPWRNVSPVLEFPAFPGRLGQLVPAFSMFLMVLLVGGASLWDATLPDDHVHEFTLSEVTGLPLLSSSELEAQYGIRVTQVAISVLDSVVDVRLKVVDPGKAEALLGEDEDGHAHAAIFVDDQALILAPHLHAHASFKPGQIYVMFFPTQNNTVRTGSEVSLVFEGLRAEAVTAK